jgi:hypothetical protein
MGTFAMATDRWRCGARLAAKGCCAIICLALFALTGCFPEIGPVAVEANHPFPGLANLLKSVPNGGSLNIFITHGMSTKADESEANLRASIAQNLILVPIGQQEQQNLIQQYPDIQLDGLSVWPAGYSNDEWNCTDRRPDNLQKCDGPYLDINRYETADLKKHVVFYSLNYWGLFVWLKCSQLVSADTHLIGDLPFDQGNAAYCNQRFAKRPGFAPIATGAVSNQAVIIDHVIKNDIMDWGFADAVIAISRYRAVLHRAVYAGLEAEATYVAKRCCATNQRYAIITESLGSYVLLDALGAATRGNDGLAALVAACRASQIHMLANQVALLRLSRTRILPEKGSPLEADEALRAQMTLPPNPPPTSCGEALPAGPVVGDDDEDGRHRPYVVGYHDPSDLLTFYLYHPAPGATHSFELQLDSKMINVVAPYAPEWIPFALADPTQAHTAGQDTDPRIQAMVSFGSNGSEPNAKWTAYPGPPPAPDAP